jgi:hypothetical protein
MKKLGIAVLAVALLGATVLRAEDTDHCTWDDHPGFAVGGPRWGALYLNPRSGDFDSFKAKVKQDYGIDLQSEVLSVFGWQFEWRLATADNGWTALSEFVPVVAGLDQGIAIPSLNWLLGFRKHDHYGFELGAGPNVSAAGAGFIIGTGVTFGSKQLSFPVNLAYAMSKEVSRVSLSVGFNLPNMNWSWFN